MTTEVVDRFLQKPDYSPGALIQYAVASADAIKRGSIPGDELQFYEQTAIAAYIVEDTALLEVCFQKLTKAVPNTERLEALEVALREKKVDGTSRSQWKRRIAKMEGREKINELVSYLEIYAVDTEALAHLASCYQEAGLHAQAVWCLHDVLLSIHTAYPIHAQLGDVYYVQENYKEALRYYLRSVELCDGYLRGLIGAKKCALQIKNGQLVERIDKDINAVLANPGERSRQEVEDARSIL